MKVEERHHYDRAMDALDLLERMLDAVDSRARRILAAADEEDQSPRPEGDQP